jgi:hypothetical protein
VVAGSAGRARGGRGVGHATSIPSKGGGYRNRQKSLFCKWLRDLLVRVWRSAGRTAGTGVSRKSPLGGGWPARGRLPFSGRCQQRWTPMMCSSLRTERLGQ